jgi:hypothetical protein
MSIFAADNAMQQRLPIRVMTTKLIARSIDMAVRSMAA